MQMRRARIDAAESFQINLAIAFVAIGCLASAAVLVLTLRGRHLRNLLRRRAEGENSLGRWAGGLRGAFRITAAAGLAATAGIRGAQVLLGPVNVLNQGIRMISVPEAARALRHSYRRLLLVGLAISFGVGAGALAWGAIFLLLPPFVGRQLLGPGVWTQAHNVLVPVILLQALGASNAGAFAILRALTAATRGLRVRLISSVVLITCGIGGAYLWGPEGAAWGLAGASFATLLLWWNEAHRAIAAHRRGRG